MLKRITGATLALAFLACSGGGGPTGTGGGGGGGGVASVSVSPTTHTATAIDEVVQFSATATDEDGNTVTDASFSWSSSETSVATVNSSGEATAVGNGTTEITATADGVSGTADLTVDQAVSAVSVTPSTVTLEGAGSTQQLTAEATDANGHTVSDASFSWSSSNTAVATVDNTGLVTAQSQGQADITADASGTTATSVVDVVPAPGAPAISSVSPDPLQEGQSATINGSDFSVTASNNTVTIDGVQATVNAATSTSLDVTVPTYDCLPSRDVTVEVSHSGGTGQAVFNLNPDEAAVSLAAGSQQVITDPSQFCLQFDASGSSESYLLGVQSTSGVVDELTDIQITSEADDGSGAALQEVPLAARTHLAPAGGGRIDVPERWQRHRAAEARLRKKERALLRRLSGVTPGPFRERAAAVAPALAVGDEVTIRVPDIEAPSSCATYTEITGVVKAMGTEAVVIADKANPSGGFTDADYQDLSDQLDNDIMATLVDYFGEPSDIDANGGRVWAVFTKEVNKVSGLLGFVFSGDLFDPSSCASSDQAEIYYGKAPDPNGDVNGTYSTSDALSDAPVTMAHEITHVIQNRRVVNGFSSGGLDSWIAEGQATFSEEVVGHAATGRSTGSNYGATDAFSTSGPNDLEWYSDGFYDLGYYFGYSSSGKVAGAPEECGWLRESPDPCDGRPLWYGVSWAFQRWISDQYGATYSGGEQGFHTDVIDTDDDGFSLITGLLGESKSTLLARWAASLYVDDHPDASSPDAGLEWASWDLYDIFVDSGSLPSTASLEPTAQSFTDWVGTGSVRAGSAGYVRIDGTRPSTAVRVRNGTGGTLPSTMQIWLVRLQ